MPQHIGAFALLVRDYDEALAWYTGVLGFTPIADTPQGEGKRWVTVSPPGAKETQLLLAKAATPQQTTQIGCQAGGRVFLILNTDDFRRDHAAYTAAGVKFLEEPRQEEYGTVAVFEDLYGNKWDLLQTRG